MPCLIMGFSHIYLNIYMKLDVLEGAFIEIKEPSTMCNYASWLNMSESTDVCSSGALSAQNSNFWVSIL